MKDISIKTRLIIIFILTGIGVFGSFMSRKLGYILAFIGIFGLAIMGIYTVIIARQQLAEIRRQNNDYSQIFQINQLREIK